jgi:hypothetical protein
MGYAQNIQTQGVSSAFARAAPGQSSCFGAVDVNDWGHMACTLRNGASAGSRSLRFAGRTNASAPTFTLWGGGFLGVASEGALEGLVQGGFCLLVFLFADAALFVVELEGEEFFL